MKHFDRMRGLVCLLLMTVCVMLPLSSAFAQEPVVIKEITLVLSQSPSLEQTVDQCIVYSSASGCGLVEYSWLDGEGHPIRDRFGSETIELQVSLAALSGYRFSEDTKALLDGDKECDCVVSEDGTSLTASIRFYSSAPGEVSTHQHSFGDWEYDNRTHWQRCGDCGQTSAVSLHTMVWENVSNVPGTSGELQKGVCSVCGYSVFRGAEDGFSVAGNRKNIGLYIFLALLALLVISIVAYNLFVRLKHRYKQKKKEKERQKRHQHHHHHHHHSSSEPPKEPAAEAPEEKKEHDGAAL